MKIGVIHYSLETLGGGEQVALHAIKAFKDHRHEVILAATSLPEPQLISTRFNLDISNCVDQFIFTKGNIQLMPFLSIYQRLFYSSFTVKKLFAKVTPDCIFITSGLCIIPEDLIDRTIIYVHYPYDHELYGGKYNSSFWKIYSTPARFIYENLYPQKEAILVTNSNFTKNIIKKIWGRDAFVVYPPVPQYTFSLENNRKNAVVTLGRFSREKRYETVLSIARSLPDIQFHLIGSCVPYNLGYLNKLKKNATKNVKFHVNISHAEKQEILSSAKVMLHTMVGEHFGIAILEAMSAGMMPVVHNSGGAKEDNIVAPEFRFEEDMDNLEDAKSKIEVAIESWDIDEARIQREKAKKFNPDRFRTQIAEFIDSHFMK
ncbi:MAG: glycosyltransferase [Nitrososphaerales archaeon]